MSAHLIATGRGYRLLAVIAVLACVVAARPAAAQETVTAPAPPKPAQEEGAFRMYAYGGYTFSSIIRHGGTVSLLFSTTRDNEKDWAEGIQATATIGQHGYALGGGWAMCGRGELPGCLDIRGVIGRTRTATENLAAQEWFAGAEGGIVLLVLRLSAGIAFPLREAGVRTPMFFGSIGFTPPVFAHNWSN